MRTEARRKHFCILVPHSPRPRARSRRAARASHPPFRRKSGAVGGGGARGPARAPMVPRAPRAHHSPPGHAPRSHHDLVQAGLVDGQLVAVPGVDARLRDVHHDDLRGNGAAGVRPGRLRGAPAHAPRCAGTSTQSWPWWGRRHSRRQYSRSAREQCGQSPVLYHEPSTHLANSQYDHTCPSIRRCVRFHTSFARDVHAIFTRTPCCTFRLHYRSSAAPICVMTHRAAAC